MNDLLPPSKGVAALDIVRNRKARKWSRKELLGRALWETIGSPLFAISPRPLWAYRRMLLRIFGAQVGADVHVFPSVRIAIPWNIQIDDQAAVGDGAILYSLGLIHIGTRATISQYAHLCAGSHDYSCTSFDLLKPPISIGEEAWICADAFIGPGVSIGARSIVGARAVVTKGIGDNLIVAGNPAEKIRVRPKIND
ncbi:hypothetical protein [Hyphomonas sp. CY54-11-8]|uniref:hypothetical protein n=1 Tax=Hyphomonas sp. CY54-11-8 TaxID=1280944 RepID=UPI0009DFFA6F|nr:hypothetical protein [Hyphomonas sp. CY54-11-8]